MHADITVSEIYLQDFPDFLTYWLSFFISIFVSSYPSKGIFSSYSLKFFMSIVPVFFLAMVRTEEIKI